MATKTATDEENKNVKQKRTVVCGARGPGPKYKLKTLVGYKDHCHSRIRGPAYSLGIRKPIPETCTSPGPKYRISSPKHVGYTFGVSRATTVKSCTPGPKYLVKVKQCIPSFSIRSRTPMRTGTCTPGPYTLPSLIGDAPAYTMFVGYQYLHPKKEIRLKAHKPLAPKCFGTPGPFAYDINVIKPRAPKYTMASKHPRNEACLSPGPKYDAGVKDKAPAYTFGMKHSDCSPPLILECDDKC